jgi:methylthioribose-1-phosphate isomerase
MFDQIGLGIALGAIGIKTTSPAVFQERLDKVIKDIVSNRPTARNLFGVAERMRRIADASGNNY